jgi:two-component system, NtrC family, sensor kinase
MAKSGKITSLQSKITTAYLAIVVITSMLGIISFLDLLFLENQVTEGEVVSDLKDAVLEMRREEKNLFLYADIDAFSRTDKQALQSLKTINEYQTNLAKIIQTPKPVIIINALNKYRTKLGLWNTKTSQQRKLAEQEIRSLGHQLSEYVELLSDQERRMLEKAVRESQRFLLISLLLIGISIFIVGHQLRKVALSPLKKLERQLSPIAEGRFNHLEPPSSDREFITFTDAFNSMLKELEIRQKRLLQSEKLASLGILTSGVAHELNNPLSNISSSCQLLIEELEEADKQQLNTWLQQIDSETERGRNIVRALLDFGSQQNFNIQRYNLLQIINDTRQFLGKVLRQSAANLIINVEEKLEINVDKQRIQQLFINLIQNALNAGGQGVHIQISAKTCTPNSTIIPDNAEVVGNVSCVKRENSDCVEIIISDNGPGIADNHLSKIFDPFYTTSEPGHGVGLGLFIVQEIVQEHNGCLAIASTLHKGTKIIILLPVEEDNNA